MERVKSVQEKTGEDINCLQETMKAKFQVAVEEIGKVQEETQKFHKETAETVKILNTKISDDLEIIKITLAYCVVILVFVVLSLLHSEL